MIYASLILNIVVLLPVAAGLLLNISRMVPVFGENTTAREILLCLYLTILVASVGLLLKQPVPVTQVQALLAAQIFYKVLSVFLIRNKKTPVLWFNLAIAIVHGITLSQI